MTEITEHQQLVALTGLTAVQLFADHQSVEGVLDKVRAEVAAFKGDISTKKGRAEITSFAHKIARTKTGLDGMGKELTDDAKKQIAAIDRERKYLRDELDKLKAEARRPLDAWEEREATRHARHKAALERMTEIRREAEQTAAGVRAAWREIDGFVRGRDWEEYEEEAYGSLAALSQSMEMNAADLEHREAEAAELERLRAEEEERKRKEEEERIARERAERDKRIAESARLEAEQVAQRQAAAERARVEKEVRDAVEREEALKREAEEHERRAKEAEARAAEAERLAAEREREMEEQRKRQAAEQEATKQATKKRQAEVHNAAVAALVKETGITQAGAKAVVMVVAQGKVSGLRFSY